MHYKYSTITIRELIALINSGKIILHPAYQRGFIWSLPDQKALVNTISKNYPLPNLFIRVLENGKMEMVDGQQRSRTIIKFYNKEIKITPRDKITICDSETFLNYTLQVNYIHNATDSEIREIYYFINRKGISLNNPETQKAYYGETLFLKLSEELANNQSLTNLDLFSDKSITRYIDREFVQELIGYLYMYNLDMKNKINTNFEGIRDKKTFIEKEMFPNDITVFDYNLLKSSFEKILNILNKWDTIFPINQTRYKQKSDFYTIFCFLNKHHYLQNDLLVYHYRILLLLNQKDKNGEQIIRPTNDNCNALKEYAINCVSQSNSKKAREERLVFWENILLNTNSIQTIEENQILYNLLQFLIDENNEDKVDLIKKSNYYLLDLEKLND